jgi:hypothetical protein
VTNAEGRKPNVEAMTKSKTRTLRLGKEPHATRRHFGNSCFFRHLCFAILCIEIRPSRTDFGFPIA